MTINGKASLLTVILVATLSLFLLFVLVGQETRHQSATSLKRVEPEAQIRDSAALSVSTENVKGDPGALADKERSRRIFSDVSSSSGYAVAIQPFLDSHPVGKFRIVEFDGDQFRETLRNSQGSPRFKVSLIDESEIELISSAGGEYHAGWQSGLVSMLGHVSGEELSTVQFIVGADNTLDGVIRSPSLGRIRIEQLPNSPYHIIWSWDSDVYQEID